MSSRFFGSCEYCIMSVTHSMNALVLERYNAPFTRTKMVRPAPRKGEVLVRIKASGLNPLDIKIRSGNASHAKHFPPAVFGPAAAPVRDECSLAHIRQLEARIL